MKYACPKCGTVLFESVPLNKKREHWAVSSEYPSLHFEHQQKGTFLACRNEHCSERFSVFFTTNKGVPAFQVNGLVPKP